MPENVLLVKAADLLLQNHLPLLRASWQKPSSAARLKLYREGFAERNSTEGEK